MPASSMSVTTLALLLVSVTLIQVQGQTTTPATTEPQTTVITSFDNNLNGDFGSVGVPGSYPGGGFFNLGEQFFDPSAYPLNTQNSFNPKSVIPPFSDPTAISPQQLSVPAGSIDPSLIDPAAVDAAVQSLVSGLGGAQGMPFPPSDSVNPTGFLNTINEVLLGGGFPGSPVFNNAAFTGGSEPTAFNPPTDPSGPAMGATSTDPVTVPNASSAPSVPIPTDSPPADGIPGVPGGTSPMNIDILGDLGRSGSGSNSPGGGQAGSGNLVGASRNGNGVSLSTIIRLLTHSALTYSAISGENPLNLVDKVLQIFEF